MLGITIGNFDGVHLGHRALLDAARLQGRRSDRVVAVTFEPAPAVVLGLPEVDRILSPSERRRRLVDAGADEVVELATTTDLLGLEPDAFLDHLSDRLADRLGDRLGAIVEGPDFRFGRGRAGDVETLRSLGAARDVEVVVVEERRIRLIDGLEVPARSSVVRRLLDLGRVEDAARVLGRPHALVGSVVKGDQRGRTIGIPTANLDLGGAMLPGDGVYAGVAALPDGSRRPAAISVGTKPTFVETPRVAEVHVLDWQGELDAYGWRLEATLDRRLRGQERYDSLDAFQAQLERDLAETRRIAGAIINADTPGASS